MSSRSVATYSQAVQPMRWCTTPLSECVPYRWFARVSRTRLLLLFRSMFVLFMVWFRLPYLIFLLEVMRKAYFFSLWNWAVDCDILPPACASACRVGCARSVRLRPDLLRCCATAPNIKGESPWDSLLPLALSTWSSCHSYVNSCWCHV